MTRADVWNELKAAERESETGDADCLNRLLDRIAVALSPAAAPREVVLHAVPKPVNLSDLSSLTARPTPGPVELPAIPLGSE